MYDKEMMITMMEDLQHQASEMEKQVKDMLEAEGRACGIELDKRKNARDLLDELLEHQDHMEDQAPMTWAYVPEDQVAYDTHQDWSTDMHTQALYETGSSMPHYEDHHMEDDMMDDMMDHDDTAMPDDGTMEAIPEEHHEDPHGGLPSDVEPHGDAEVKPLGEQLNEENK